ncbi:MAG: acyl-CoA dehydrogenase family protein [Chloroflexota bacterium]|nr:acyl-CoA dehydrogenase family protein [Chloroflexota bacterium]
MAGFGFTEAQEMLRKEVRNFAQKELAQGAKERSKQDTMPRETIKKLGDAGYLGVPIPEEYGGQGSDWVSFGITVEELAKVDFIASLIPLTPGVAYVVLQHASNELKDEYIPQTVKGEKIACFAITEPDTGSDAAAMRSKAVKDSDHYVIDGEKTSITAGFEGDYSIMFVKTDPTARARGITCFWLPLDLPGITRTRIPHTGFKATAAASIMMDGVRVPAKFRVGEEGEGFYKAMGGADFLRIGLSLMGIGLAEVSLEEAAAYAVQRNAFGKPIAQFEGVSFKIAEHATRLEAARLLCYRALYLKDQGQPHTKESSMCKWWCPVVAFDAVHDSLLIHGHVGYSEESTFEQRLRDVMGLEFADGTAQIQKIIIARELMGRVAVPY